MIDIETEFLNLHKLKTDMAAELQDIEDTLAKLQEQRAIIAEPYEAAIRETEATIKSEIILQAKSFKCAYGKATYRKGAKKVSWNDDALLGYAVTHPEIEQFRQETEGKPSVVLQ